MGRDRWSKFGRSLALEFWLPLPFLGFVFWLGSGWLADQVISHPQPPRDARLQPQPQISLALRGTIVDMEAIIDRPKQVTYVMVRTSDSTLRQFQLELLETDFQRLEQAIGQELQLTPEQVRSLVRYQIH